MKSAILALLLLAGVGAAPAAARVRLGGVMVGGGYTHWAGPYWGPWCCGYYGYGWDPLFYSPYYPNGFGWGPGLGEVKLHADHKDAEVFLDGAYAGTVKERKSMWLKPGAYNLEVREDGKTTYTKRIYVLSGKAMHIDADRGGRP